MMKKKKFLLILFLCLASANFWAQEMNYPTGSLLWKISGNGLEKPSYILGTFHLKSGAYLDSIAGARAAMEKCEQTVCELITNNITEMQIQATFGMAMPTGTNYHQLYSDEDYRFIDRQLISFMDIGLDRMGALKPAAIQAIISVMNFLKVIPNFDPEDVLDKYIQEEATNHQKLVVALETVDDQIVALFDYASLPRQAELLLCYLKNTDEIVSQEINSVINAYDIADLNTLYFEVVQEKDNPCPLNQKEKDILVKDRNDKWIQKLPILMKEHSSFIAVGAGHIAGKEGLLYQLMELGYKVEAVR